MASRKAIQGYFGVFLGLASLILGGGRTQGVGMADVIFVALTIAIFVVLGLIVKAVERL
ncbi:hypothetical protein ACWEPC_50530 [Nonomuraea sp. NPDC004297]